MLEKLDTYQTETLISSLFLTYFFVRKVDNGKLPQLQKMELLTPDTAKPQEGKNTVEMSSNILSESHEDDERYSNEVDEGKENGKEIEDENVKNGFDKCENRSHGNMLAIEEIAFTNFGDKIDEKDNKSLESKPFDSMEMNQFCEGPIDDANDDTGELIAKDMLCFAWQIARGMVSDEQ